MTGYVQLGELKDQLRIVDSVDDTVLLAHIQAASATVDELCRRTFTQDSATSDRLYHPDSIYSVRIDDVATTTGLEVRVGLDGDLVDLVAVQTEPLNALAKGRPIEKLVSRDGLFLRDIHPTVKVTARWGWPAVPEPVKSATAILAGRLYKRADSLLGVAGFGDLGAMMVRAVDPDVQRMLAPYTKGAIA